MLELLKNAPDIFVSDQVVARLNVADCLVDQCTSSQFSPAMIALVMECQCADNLSRVFSGTSGVKQPALSSEAFGHNEDGHACEKPEAHDRRGIPKRRRR